MPRHNHRSIAGEAEERRARVGEPSAGSSGGEPRSPAGEVVPAPAWYRPRRPPFGPGNEVATTHGSWSPRRVDPLAERFAGLALGTAAWLSDSTFGPAVWAWARAEARCQLLAEWLDEHGPLAEDGDPRPALDAATRLEKLAMTHRQRLGLDPSARASLEATLTSAVAGQFALEDAITRGRDSLASRQPPGGPTASVRGLDGPPAPVEGPDGPP